MLPVNSLFVTVFMFWTFGEIFGPVLNGLGIVHTYSGFMKLLVVFVSVSC